MIIHKLAQALIVRRNCRKLGQRVNRPTEDVVIRDSIVRDGAAGVTFGSETAGGFRDIEAYNITVLDKVPVGILFKSAHTRGGFGENLRLHDFTMKGTPAFRQCARSRFRKSKESYRPTQGRTPWDAAPSPPSVGSQ